MMDIKNLKNIFENKKILYVEDDEYLCEVNRESLEVFCNNVFIALDGKIGLEIFEKNQDIELILTDVTMEEMDGIEMALKIKEINPNIIIIARTSHSEQYLKDNFPKYNENVFNHILQKPFDFVDLFGVLGKYFS